MSKSPVKSAYEMQIEQARNLRRVIGKFIDRAQSNEDPAWDDVGDLEYINDMLGQAVAYIGSIPKKE